MKTSKTLLHLPALLAFGLATATTANAAAATAATGDESTVVLSPFEVSTSTDNSYVATNSATGTRIAMPLVQLPFTANA